MATRACSSSSLLGAAVLLLAACGGTGSDSDRKGQAVATCDLNKVPPIAELSDPGSGPFSCPTPAADPAAAAQGYQYFFDAQAELQLDVIDDFENGAANGTWYTQNDFCWLCAKSQGLDGGLVPNALQMFPVLSQDACLCRCQQAQLPRHFEKPIPAELIPGGRCNSRYAMRLRGGPFPDDGMKVASQMQSNPVNAYALGYEGIAFWARIGGETGPTGLQASRNTLNLQTSDIFTDEKPGMVVDAGGYLRSTGWHGYAFTAVSGAGNTVSPQDFSAHPARQPLCMSVSLGAATAPTDGAMIGLHVNQNPGETSLGTVVPTGAGLFVGYNGTFPVATATDGAATGPKQLRALIQGPNAAVDPNDSWCASLTAAGGVLPWGTFNTSCWDNSGTYYAGQPIASAALVLVAGPQPAPFSNFCLTSLSDGVAYCQSTTPLDDTRQGCDKPNAFALLTSDWRFFALPFSEMRQAGWGKKEPYLDLAALMSVQFHFGAGQWDVWIDDPAYYRRKAP